MKKLIYISVITILSSCGTLKITPNFEISERAQYIAGANILAFTASQIIAPETRNPMKTTNYIWGFTIPFSFAVAITDPVQHRKNKHEKSLINK